MLKGFKEFVIRGNVIDLAVALIIGVAFNNLIAALVKDVITPFIGTFGGQPDFSGIFFTINNSKFMIGDFINLMISFLINAAVIYFFIVVPMNKLKKKDDKKELSKEKTCPECLSLIPEKAKRCKYCTAKL
jgi:large conductance mechanosensitive channel